MENSILIAVISAGLGAFTVEIFKLINKLIDNKKEKREYEEKGKKDYLEKKETVYSAAIGRLLQIRKGFDITREQLNIYPAIKDDYEKKEKAFDEIAPKLRLYSDDRIFNIYHSLAQRKIYAYAREGEPRLCEDAKKAYEKQITILSRLMQEDLGYRKYISEPETIICPDCGFEHDIVGTCPNCKMTFSELQTKLNEIIDGPRSENDQG